MGGKRVEKREGSWVWNELVETKRDQMMASPTVNLNNEC